MEKWFTIAEQIYPYMQQGDLNQCETIISDYLSQYSNSPFYIAINSHFSNDPKEVAENFDKFIRREQAKYKVAAIYTEMNGFDINPERWYYDLFAYKVYGGHDDYDWLSDWDSDYQDDVTLTGMEELQLVYKNEELSQEEVGIASLLIVVRFQQLIKEAISHMKKGFPILATAHEYDLIYEG
jgi:hypothetical protein